MKITFLTAGSSNIGIGHLIRISALANEYVQRGLEVSIVADIPNDTRLAALLPKNHLKGGVTEACAIDSELVITDHPRLSKEDSQRFRRHGCHFLAYLTDYKRDQFYADLYVDTDEVCDLPLANPDATLLRGIQYTIIADAVRRARPKAAHRPTAITSLLLVLGGADPGNLTEMFAKTLPWKDKGIALTIIAGPAWTHERLEKLYQQSHAMGFHVEHAPREIEKLILSHDLIVTLGGIVTFEAMCLGRPVASLSWRHMTPYVEKFAKLGLLIDLGESLALWQKRLLYILQQPATLSEISQRGFNAVDGQAATRLFNDVLEAYQQSRSKG